MVTIRFIEETTDWGSHQVSNHIYITESRALIGYVPMGTETAIYFKKPLSKWSPYKRKFRNLTKKESQKYVQC